MIKYWFNFRIYFRSTAIISTKSHRFSRDLESIEVERESPNRASASKSQPCSPSPTKRPLKKQARLAEQDEEIEIMPINNGQVNGDCYSSTEYVQFATARNAYENGEFLRIYWLFARTPIISLLEYLNLP